MSKYNIKPLIKTSNSILNKLKERFSSSDLYEELYKKKISYYATKSSLNTLLNTNSINMAYLIKVDDKAQSDSEELLHVFGIMQSLFVSIDSLYELSRGITRRKWSVNINQNKHLLEIKYIRNDVVGHPSYRVYSKQDIGFCELELEDVDITTFKYAIYTVVDNKETKEERTVYIPELLYNYYLESNIILQDIFNRFEYEENMIKDKISNALTDDVYMLYKDYINDQRTNEIIKKIKDSYVRYKKVDVNSKDRFIWRCNLILMLFEWEDEDENKQRVIEFITKMQIQKLHSMAMSFDKDHKLTFIQSKFPPIGYPALIKNFYKFGHKRKIKLVNT